MIEATLTPNAIVKCQRTFDRADNLDSLIVQAERVDGKWTADGINIYYPKKAEQAKANVAKNDNLGVFEISRSECAEKYKKLDAKNELKAKYEAKKSPKK